ncbi:MAG: hypothetical protein WCI43_02380 [Candidatus Firestonebacteria bacterium]
MTNGGPGPGNWHSAVSVDSTVSLVVCSFDFKEPAEEGWMWIDPSLAVEPSAASAAAHAKKITHFMFNSLNAGGNAKSNLTSFVSGQPSNQ